MPTLTLIEDGLRDSPVQAEQWQRQLRAIQHRLRQAMISPVCPAQYQQFTVLLEAALQAEDILNGIYFRYHNAPLGCCDMMTQNIKS